MKRTLVTALAIACTAVGAEPLTITGPARVIDGDTIVVAGVHIQLAEDGKKFKVDPSRRLYALRWLNWDEPPDLDLTLVPGTVVQGRDNPIARRPDPPRSAFV
jgi:hypothetical protein